VVDREDLTRHDKWLCMMLPRLKLLRDFLTDDGLMAVSTDDNEGHRLRCLLDEVFGKECFLGQIVWKTHNTDNRLKSNISEDHKYVLVYGRSGADEVDGIMGRRVFAFPKSLEFMTRVVDYLCNDEGIVLDAFGGTGTTAHAALALNKVGGKRRFILIEGKDIADSLTAERLRRVIKGVPKAKDVAL
jgi:adenine specific DNA methylase Mod